MTARGQSGMAELRRRLGRAQSEIARALDREFERQFHEVYGKSPDRDPALQTLFFTLASEIARVHDDAQRVFPEAVLDDVVAGLGTPPRVAEASQTVLEFSNISVREWVTPDTVLSGRSPKGDRIPFSPDEPFQVSTARVGFAAVLEPGFVEGLSGVEADGKPVRLNRAEVRTGVEAPILLLGLSCDPAHLSYLSLFLDCRPTNGRMAGFLENSVWRVLNAEGTVHRLGALRSTPGRRGTRRLVWFDAPDGLDESPASEVASALALGRATYGPLVYRFPFVPPDRRIVGGPPPRFRATLERVLPAKSVGLLDRPMTWLEIMLPPAATGRSSDLRGVYLNAMSASNAEVVSEMLSFSRTGQAVAHSPEGVSRRHVLGVVSVQGSSPYVHQADLVPDSEGSHGIWSYRSGRIEVSPGRSDSGRLDTHANVRILFCDGEEANHLDLDAVNRVETTALENVGLRVRNVVVSKGGAAPPSYAEAKVRFAAAVRTRDRVVTEGDFEILARAFDSRIRTVAVDVASTITSSGLQVAEVISVSVDRSLFADPEAELPVLLGRLEEHLAARVGIGRVVRVEAAS